MESFEIIKELVEWKENNPALFKVGTIVAAVIYGAYIITFTINSGVGFVAEQGRKVCHMVTKIAGKKSTQEAPCLSGKEATRRGMAAAKVAGSSLRLTCIPPNKRGSRM